MNYEYDGTFFGFLSAVFDAYYDGIRAVETIRPAASASLFADSRYVPSDPGKAGRILSALQRQCGGKTCHFLYYAFLSEAAAREEQLLTYIRLAFHYKRTFLQHLSDKPIWDVRQLARKTGNERHKLLGLVRFRELSDGTLYARLSPTCCVVPVMASHFTARLPEENWVIHDVHRHFGVWYEDHRLTLVDIPQTQPSVSLSADEQQLNQLWQSYYETIAIKARRNELVRRSYMPKKYWPWLIEDARHT